MEYAAAKMELLQQSTKISRAPRVMQEHGDENATHAALVLPSDWPDQDQLLSLYHEILLGDEWSAPTQAQLTRVHERNMDPKRHVLESAGDVYEKWQPDEPWPQTYREYTGSTDAWSYNTLDTISTLKDLGLEESSMLLEIGCGPLRLGRMFIQFLARGHYHCVDPTRELIQDGIKFELGYDLLQRKLPSFSLSEEFRAPPGLSKSLVGFDAAATGESPTYTFMVAISIFTHTGDDLLREALTNLKSRFATNTRLLATFHFAPCRENSLPSNAFSGWIYAAGKNGWANDQESEPKWACYDPDRLTELLQVHGLTWDYVGEKLPGSTQQKVSIYPQGNSLLSLHDK
jgi:hypothetical protein